MKIWPGEPYPLGARYDGNGTNFAVYSEVARRVELCLFDDDGTQTAVDLPEVTAYTWHGYVPYLRPGQRYGFRVDGPYDPKRGVRCNPAKLLLDPYALAIEGTVTWDDAVFAYRIGDRRADLSKDDRDSAPFVPRSVVVNPFFDWSNDHPPRTPWRDTVIYEAHVKGLTAKHPDVAPELRGTYAGLAAPEVIEHLRRIGITAVELLPIHQFIHARQLVERGLRNYWGYDSIGYFAPHNEYSATGQRGEQVQEFKQMVKTLHAAGIEVILDVVYNHTAEGNHLGPMLSFRGLDNAAYYRLTDDPRYYMDYTGTGNSLNMRHPHVLQLIMDSLRFWVSEMHVDGFRFDLAATLARELHDVDRLSAFFDLIQQDPIVRQVKLIAEPWDVGAGGYQVGNFPPLWSEWNGRYRDTVRDYWRGTASTLGELASRFTGSSDLYESSGRKPYNSVNFVTAHDGFSLADLVSYDHKHNEANGEANRDGYDDNRSWNCGVEGSTDDPEVLRLRGRQMRNFVATLFLSQGVPMLLHGDELARSKGGNNNTYCQDHEISYMEWTGGDTALLAFVERVSELRRTHPVFRRRRWFQGRPIHGKKTKDVAWFAPDGVEMSDRRWNEASARALAVFLDGDALGIDDRGQPEHDDSFLLLFNASAEDVPFVLPDGPWAKRWVPLLDTFDPELPEGEGIPAKEQMQVRSRSLVLLRRAD